MYLSKRSKLGAVFSWVGFAAIIGGLLLTGALQRYSSAHAAGNEVVRQITSSGTTSITATSKGKDGVSAPEVNQSLSGLGQHVVNRGHSVASQVGANASATPVRRPRSPLLPRSSCL